MDESWVRMGDDIMVTALFAVLVCGPLGVIASQLGAKYLLDPVCLTMLFLRIWCLTSVFDQHV